jgi:hypothetical protein
MNRFWAFLWVGGAALYAANTLFSSNVPIAAAPERQIAELSGEKVFSSRVEAAAVRPAKAAAPAPAKVVTAATEPSVAHTGSLAAVPLPPKKALAMREPPASADNAPGLRARVVSFSGLHEGASYSSPTITHYYPDAELEVLKTVKGWSEVKDPATKETGWILSAHLSTSGKADGAVEEPAKNAKLQETDIQSAAGPAPATQEKLKAAEENPKAAKRGKKRQAKRSNRRFALDPWEYGPRRGRVIIMRPYPYGVRSYMLPPYGRYPRW